MRLPPSLPGLPAGLAVALCAADEADDALLSPDERDRATALAHADRRRGFVAGRVAARTLLGDRLGVSPATVPLTVAADGAPVVGGGALYVSIAHAGRGAALVGAAVASTGPVGVDLEAIVPRRPDLWQRMLRADEHALLDALGGPTDRAQTLLWSLKEAVLKGQRTGLRAGTRSVRLGLDLSEAAAVVPDVGTGIAAAEASGRWQLSWTDLGGMWLSVAWADDTHGSFRGM